MEKLVGSMTFVKLGCFVAVVGSCLARGEIFTAYICSIDLI